VVEEAALFQLAVQRSPVAGLTPTVALPSVVSEAAAGWGHDTSELGHPFSPERLLASVRPRRPVVDPPETDLSCANLVVVTELARGHCEACAPGTPPLPEREAAELSSEVPDWERDGNRALRREFSFPDFRDAFGFVARAALIAEAEGHHPDIELGWGRASFELTTHAASGLTRNDFVLAAKIDQLADA
jgi:4a-hydroxytetrahydrobiopterin dehydratase